MPRLVAALVLIVLIGAHVLAARQDERVSITGRVIDAATLRPLAGAAVHASGLEVVVRSDADGRFTLPPLAPGSYVIGARLDGYRPADAPVTVAHGAAAPPVEFALVPETLRLAESVSVTATREEREAFDVPRSVSVVPETELLRTAPRTGAEALTRAPGVFEAW